MHLTQLLNLAKTSTPVQPKRTATQQNTEPPPISGSPPLSTQLTRLPFLTAPAQVVHDNRILSNDTQGHTPHCSLLHPERQTSDSILFAFLFKTFIQKYLSELRNHHNQITLLHTFSCNNLPSALQSVPEPFQKMKQFVCFAFKQGSTANTNICFSC